MKIDGREIARKILEELKVKVKKLKEKNITPHLAIILVGNDPASTAYVKQKELKAQTIGIRSTTYNSESTIRNSELISLIGKLNKDKSVHGIIAQQPLPSQINLMQITQAIDPAKDVDGFHKNSKFQPPIAEAVLEILKPYLTKSKKIVVIGKGETGGKPIIESLRRLGLAPEIVDSKTKNSESLTKSADILISAVGKPNVVKPEMIKKRAILISIGMHKGSDGKLHGDYDEERIKNIASFYTPTPGGVGPVNVAMLLKNAVNAAKNLNH